MRADKTQLIAAADLNFIGSFAKLVALQPGAALRRVGRAVVFDSRIPIRIFNGLAVLEPTTPSQVLEALDWLNGRAIPYAVWVREEVADPVRPTLQASSLLQSEWPEPVMGIQPPDRTPATPDEMSVREAQDDATLEDHIQATVSGGWPSDAVRMVFMPGFLTDRDVRMFTAYVDGQPVGHSVAIRSGDVSGVYSVGVVEQLRGRGIGTAVTWAAVQAGREWGCELVVLQSSEMGFGLYRRMGFEVLTRYEMFRTPSTDS